jgi:hypothetical protein
MFQLASGEGTMIRTKTFEWFVAVQNVINIF